MPSIVVNSKSDHTLWMVIMRGQTTCYEFAGCFYHGCVKCHVQSHLNPVTKVPYDVLYGQFNEKITALKTLHGCRVVVMWECE